MDGPQSEIVGVRTVPERRREFLWDLLAVIGGALALAWPALFNRYPLFYSDSIGYLQAGRLVAGVMLKQQVHSAWPLRSEIYSLGILAVHWNTSPWPIVGLQALMVSYVVWLVVRSIVGERSRKYYLAMTAVLSLLTSAGWFASVIMPDILGGLAYLCMYLLVFAWAGLKKIECWIVASIAWWGLASHSTHLTVGAGLCGLLVLGLLCRWGPMRGRVRQLGVVVVVLVVAACSQLWLHDYLYGTPTLNGDRPPFLMARIVADGPGRWYLQQNCGHLDWAICKHAGELPANDGAFLWMPGGVWSGASAEDRSRMREEEMPLVVAAVRAYPGAEMRRSMGNFWEQFSSFGLHQFVNDPYIPNALGSIMPGARAAYLRSLEARDALPLDVFSAIQWWVVVAAGAGLAAGLPVAWKRRRERVQGLAAVILAAVVANALVCGVLSGVYERYQARVVWLIPMLAMLMAVDLFVSRQEPGPG